jgi:hypothetical protein
MESYILNAFPVCGVPPIPMALIDIDSVTAKQSILSL